MAKSLVELIKLTRKDIEKVRKEDLIDSILAARDDDIGALGRVEVRLERLSNEVNSLRQAYTQAEQATGKRITELEKKMEKQAEIILSQQLYLENIDRKQRETHLILLGIPEGQDPLEGATVDEEKVKKIWSTIGLNDVKLVSQKRLGRVPDDDRKRPILVILEDREARDNILQKAKILKEKGEVYRTVYLKRMSIQK